MGTINIEVVKGGFILETYNVGDSTREVITSPRKLTLRVKELIEKLSLVDSDAE